MRGWFFGSLLLHVAVVFVAYFGLPHMKSDLALLDTAIIVNVVHVEEDSNPPPKPVREKKSFAQEVQIGRAS